MKVNVLFFGATADAAGARTIELDVAEGATSSDALERVLAEHRRLSEHNLLYSVNQVYAEGDELLREGDELAVFTAVSGG